VIRLLDGPAAGSTLSLQRAPVYLRVVIDPAGKVDALDQLDDMPEDDEVVYVYTKDPAGSSGTLFACGRGGAGGHSQRGHYRHEAEVDGEAFRDNPDWQDWASNNPLGIA
jgi:hypothetical protein